MEGIKESLVAAGEALQSMVEEVERFEKEMEELYNRYLKQTKSRRFSISG